MKWVVWFILACVGVVAIFLIGVWIAGGLHGLGQNLNIALAAGLGILLASATRRRPHGSDLLQQSQRRRRERRAVPAGHRSKAPGLSDSHRSSRRKGMSRAAGARALRETSAMATMVSTKGSIRKT